MASDLDLPKMIEAVKVAFEALAKEKSVQQLQQVITHNKQLIHDNERLKILYEGNLDSIAELKTEAQDNAKAAEKTRAELQSRQKKIDALTKSHGETKIQVKDLTKQLEESSSHITELGILANQKGDHAARLQEESDREKKKLKDAITAQEQLQSKLNIATQHYSETKASLESYTSLRGKINPMGKDAM